jgi:hypothetical protein
MIKLRSTPVPPTAAEMIRRHAAVGLRCFTWFSTRSCRDLLANRPNRRAGTKNVWTSQGSVAPFLPDGSSTTNVPRSSMRPRGGRTSILKLSRGTPTGGQEDMWVYGNQGFFYATGGTTGWYNGSGPTTAASGYGTLAITASDTGPVMRLFTDGRNAPPGVNPSATLVDPVPRLTDTVGAAPSGVQPFSGTIAWHAEFNRVLSRAEMLLWSTDWPFDGGDDEILMVAGGPPTVSVFYANSSTSADVETGDDTVSYATGISTADAGAGNYPMAVSTSVGLGVFLGGSLSSASPTDAAFSTLTQADAYLATGLPDVVLYANTTYSAEAFAPDAPASFTTTTQVRSAATALNDGRFDLLDTTRYRR